MNTGGRWRITKHDGLWWLVHPTGLARPHVTWQLAITSAQQGGAL